MHRILLLTLIAALVGSGCAQHRVMPATFALAHTQAGATRQHLEPLDPEVLRKYVTQLPLGTTVRIELTDGKSLIGTLMAVEQDVVIVQPRTRLPERERRIPLRTIVSLAPDSKNLNVGKAMAIGVGTGVASFLGLFLVVWYALGD